MMDPKQRRILLCKLIGMGILIVGGIVAGILFLTVLGSNDAGSFGGFFDAATIELRISQFQTTILANSLTSSETIMSLDAETPQSLAIEWLAGKDPLMLDPTNTTQYTEIVERYAVVTLYFATHTGGGGGTTNGGGGGRPNSSVQKLTDNWMTGARVCNWDGILCKVLPKLQSTTQNEAEGVPFEVANELPQSVLIETQKANMVNRVTSINLSGLSLMGTVPSELSHLNTLQELALGT